MTTFWETKRDLIDTVRVMERRGVRIDTEFCNLMVNEADAQMGDLLQLTEGLNPMAPMQVSKYMVEELGLPILYNKKKLTPGMLNSDGSMKNPKHKRIPGDNRMYLSPTTDSKAMAKYEMMLEKVDDPMAGYILQYRGWSKAKSAFYGAYLKHLSPDGRLRPNYQHQKDEEEGGTLTGRLSCKDPNLQQIPKKSDKPWNGTVKKSFIGTEGYTLWEFDYAQLEFRIGAAYAKEMELIEAFNDPDRDVFTEASVSMGLGLTRQQTKTLFYSMQYGAGVPRIMDALGLDQRAAANVRDNYYSTYPGFKKVSERAAAYAKRDKRVQLWSGRYRHLSNPAAEAHKAFNSVVQGGAADIVERTMVRLYKEIDVPSRGECNMLLQVHDSVIFEIRNGMEDRYGAEIQGIMSDVNSMFNFGVDFRTSMEILGGK